MKKVLVVISAFGLGGITSFAIPFINYLCDTGNEVTVLYGRDDANYISRLRKDVKFKTFRKPSSKNVMFQHALHGHGLDLLRIKFRNPKKFNHIASLQRMGYRTAEMMPMLEGEYDVAISTSEFFCNAYIAKKVRAKKKIGWVHPNLETLNIDVKRAREIASRLDKIVAVSGVGRDYLQSILPEKGDAVTYIDNMLETEHILKLAKEPIAQDCCGDALRIVSVCRIENTSKRVDRMLRCAKMMAERGFRFQWHIVGNGIDYQGMKSLAKELGLEEQVIFTGAQLNPYPYIQNADVFVMTSQYEGKPIVVEEAKLLGIPVVTTEYGSAKEQLQDCGGYVAINQDGVCEEEIAEILMNKDKMQALQEAARAFVYSNAKSENAISNLLQD